MPRIITLGNLAIFIYPDDHAPPHFHVRGPDLNALVEIDTLQILRGCVPRSSWPQIVTWAAENKSLLMEKWTEFNERG